jgi:hypothetical protein
MRGLPGRDVGEREILDARLPAFRASVPAVQALRTLPTVLYASASAHRHREREAADRELDRLSSAWRR